MSRRPALFSAAVAAAGLALAACGSSWSPPDGGTDAPAESSTDVPAEVAGDGASDRVDGGARETGPGDGGYAADGPCTAGVPRCHGDFGYQMCEQDGTWSESHSCAGYSANGTTSYCAEIPMDSGGTWATCVDPACWYWLGRGTPAGASAVGICQPDGTIRKCSAGGTLSSAACDGVCTRVATLDTRPVGYCAPACADGARECLGGPLYRTCAQGRWNEVPSACNGDCNPLSKGALPDIRCGGACDPGTSRCGVAGIEVCTPAGKWAPDRTCVLGSCRQAGPQAQCEAECAAGQHDCAFDGAGTERKCIDTGRWTAETACGAGTSCRMSGDLALGCVACVGTRPGGGNAYGAADRRCGSQGIELCGADNAWHADDACPAGTTCSTIQRGPSSLAACQSPP